MNTKNFKTGNLPEDAQAASLAASIVTAYRQQQDGRVVTATAVAAEDQRAASMAASIMQTYRRYHPENGAKA